MKQIIITFDDSGDNLEVKLETKGYGGAECLKDTEEFERYMGVKSMKKTPEFFKPSQTKKQATI